MTSVTEERWLRARNLSADAKGSIHDDDRARSLGFKAALIGGSILCAFATQELVRRFGQAWFERGFLKQAFIHPLYETDEFRVAIEEQAPDEHDEQLVALALETRDGAQITAGYAGLVRDASATALAPWQRPGEPPLADAGGGDPLPDENVGVAYPPQTRTVTFEDSASRRDLTGEDSPWYRERSPWAGPIVPSFMYMLLGGGGRPAARREQNAAVRAGMNGTFQLLQSGPMFVGQPYTVQGKLVEKGYGRRSAFRTNEFTVTDDRGRRVAIARQKIRWMASPESTD